jgi:hypothetical protein
MSNSQNRLKLAVATACLLALVKGSQTLRAAGAHTDTVTVTAAS